MEVITVRNVHSAFIRSIGMLKTHGVQRESRNGPVLQYPMPVSTVYYKPTEKIIFHPDRDYNIAFALYEALWMLSGRNDVKSLQRYVKDFNRFSDDGATLYGAYGYRWKKQFGYHQLEVIAERLKKDPLDRRCVLSMWDGYRDLGADSKDIPCNTVATFQVDNNGDLNLVVFCRSNDTILGAYFANAFQFGTLLEYMAVATGYTIGTYTQVSVNWHSYLSEFKKYEHIKYEQTSNPYMHTQPQVVMTPPMGDVDFKTLETQIAILVSAADAEFKAPHFNSIHNSEINGSLWAQSAWCVLYAHNLYKKEGAEVAYDWLVDQIKNVVSVDMVVAMKDWLARRIK